MNSRILIVEDEAKLREVLSDYFRSKGEQPFEAANGREALRLLEENDYDAVLMDIMMPELDGLSLCRAVRKTNSKITGAFNEGIMGAKTTKTLVREEMNMEEFTELTHTMKRSSVRAASLSAVYLPIVVSLGSIATAYALWQGGQQVIIGGMTLGVLQVFGIVTAGFLSNQLFKHCVSSVL